MRLSGSTPAASASSRARASYRSRLRVLEELMTRPFAPSSHRAPAPFKIGGHRSVTGSGPRTAFRPSRSRIRVILSIGACGPCHPAHAVRCSDESIDSSASGGAGQPLGCSPAMSSASMTQAYSNGSAFPTTALMLSRVAGSGPRPSANSRSSIRRPCSSPGRPKFPSLQRGS